MGQISFVLRSHFITLCFIEKVPELIVLFGANLPYFGPKSDVPGSRDDLSGQIGKPRVKSGTLKKDQSASICWYGASLN